MTNWLIILAIGMFVADVAMRRFQFVPGGLHRRSRKREEMAENAPQGMSSVLNEDMSKKDITDNDSLKISEKKRREPKRPKKKEQSEQTLDTSQLLKKKDDRFI